MNNLITKNSVSKIMQNLSSSDITKIIMISVITAGVIKFTDMAIHSNYKANIKIKDVCEINLEPNNVVE